MGLLPVMSRGGTRGERCRVEVRVKTTPDHCHFRSCALARITHKAITPG